RRGEPAAALVAEIDRLAATPAESQGSRDRAAIVLARSELALRMGDAKAALTAADQAIADGGEVPMLLLARANANLAAGKTDAALTDLEAAYHKAPAALAYVDALVRADELAGKFDAAGEIL